MACGEARRHRGAEARRVLPRDRRRAEPHPQPPARRSAPWRMDIGAFTPFTHAIREREYINDLFEELCGARLTFNYMRIGGVGWDLPPGWTREGRSRFLDRFEPLIDEYNELISFNKIYVERLANVAVISPRRRSTTTWSARTCAARASSTTSGATMPYSIYPELEFDVPVGTRRGAARSATASTATSCACARCRRAAASSASACARSPTGPVIAKVPRNFKPPAGDAYVRVESARGDMGWYVVSDGTDVPYRVQDPHRLVRRHQHHRPKREPRPHDRRPDRGHREPRPGRAGDRPLTACRSSSTQPDRRAASLPAGVPAWVHVPASPCSLFGGIVVFGFVLPIAGITTWVERRVMGAHPEPHRAEPRRPGRASSSGSPTASRTC